MFFWDIEKLNESLKKGLSESEKFKYLLAYSVIGGLILFLPNEASLLSFLNASIEFVGMIVLLFVFYKINGGVNGKDIFSRYFAISFVTLIRSIVFLLIPLMIIYSIILAVVYGNNIPLGITIFDLQMTLLYIMGYFYLTIKYLKQLLKK